jgi:rare lipoprotein A (peptidoglycan hydrolase)
LNPAVLQRQAALVAAAWLAGLGVVVLHRADEPSATAPQPAPTAEVRWQNAVVGVFGPGRYGETTACGVELTDRTMGIAHPVLPCGVDLVVSFRGRELRTEVVDQGPAESDRQFDLTKALADALGVEGTQTIRWRFAG